MEQRESFERLCHVAVTLYVVTCHPVTLEPVTRTFQQAQMVVDRG